MFTIGIVEYAARENGKYHINSPSLSVLVSALGWFLVVLGLLFAFEVLTYDQARHPSKPEKQRKELLHSIRLRLTYQTILCAMQAFSSAVSAADANGHISNNLGLDWLALKVACGLIFLVSVFGIAYFAWRMIKSMDTYTDSETAEY